MMPRGQCFFSWCFFWWRAGLYEVSCCLIQVLMRKEIQLASDFLIWCELLSTFLHSFIPFFLHSFLPGPITFQGHRYINTNTYIQKTIGTAAFWTSERNYLRVIFRETLTTDRSQTEKLLVWNTSKVGIFIFAFSAGASDRVQCGLQRGLSEGYSLGGLVQSQIMRGNRRKCVMGGASKETFTRWICQGLLKSWWSVGKVVTLSCLNR